MMMMVVVVGTMMMMLELMKTEVPWQGAVEKKIMMLMMPQLLFHEVVRVLHQTKTPR
jgi:hypothetical protein